MLGYKLLYLASLIAFTFGALTFSVLTLYYWRERRSWRRRMGAAFPTFTLVCAAAFIANLLLRVTALQNQDSAWAISLSTAQALLTGLLPPLLFQLVLSEAEPSPSGPGPWRITLVLFYAAAIVAAVAHALNDADLLPAGWSDSVEMLPAATLGVASTLGLIAQVRARGPRTAPQQRYRRWTQSLLSLMLLCSVASMAASIAAASLLPDYLILAFFCVTLYYKERLVFFDVLIKRGAFLLVALVALTAFFFIDGSFVERLPDNWSGSWISALLLVPLWLIAPWLYARLTQAIDRICLHRRFSPAEAERSFIAAIQTAATEEQLRRLSEASLGEIFQSRAAVFFTAADEPPVVLDGGLTERLFRDPATLGWMLAHPRPNSIPYMSDDSRLLQSLARTLSVMLENVRFRERQLQQDEREQQLRLLASRAELKALRAQINPHFLFNALNAIAGLIVSNPELADATIEQLAQVFRYTLRKSENEWVRLDEELEFVSAYLNVERARFGERLRVDFEVDPAAGAVPVPAMTIQPLVENAIKHGVSGVDRRGLVRLRVQLRGERLTIEVFDNGPGFPAAFRLGAAGHGLRNVAERIAGYYGDDARLAWDSGGEGARVWIEMPVLMTSHASSDRG